MKNATNQPQIGLLVGKTSDGAISIPAKYSIFANSFGNIRPVFVYDEKVHADLDILILMGGADVNPFRYGEKPHFETQNPNIQYEWWDTLMLPEYIKAGVPIFGICRGFQTLNVHLGGKLSQDINQEYSEKSRGELVDNLTVVNNQSTKQWLRSIGFKDVDKVYKTNSLHHQGFYYGQKGVTVVPLMLNSKFENVEAFITNDFKVAGVQWHPEELDYCTLSNCIIKHLIANR